MELLIDLYKIHSKSGSEKPMKKFIRKWVERNIEGVIIEYDQKGNMYLTKGESDTYPCVVAHLDQVQVNHSKDFVVYNMDGVLCGYSHENKRFEGIGGDDKNGLWVALRCLEMFDILKCAFFVEEEIGCQGSSFAKLEWFNDCRFVLQCDRRGAHDLITTISWTKLCSDEFLSATNYEQFGYVPTTGMMTDVLELKENIDLCMLNISCGYYDPHSDNEYTVFDDLVNCLNFVCNIILNCTDVYVHKSIDEPRTFACLGGSRHGKYGYGSYGSYGGYGGYGSSLDFLELDTQPKQIGEVIDKEVKDLSDDYYNEYYDIYDSVYCMVQQDPNITARNIYASYSSCLAVLEESDIEYMIEEIKNEIGML